MIVLILVTLLILVLAWACYTYAPRPLNVIGGVVLFICALIYFVSGLDGVDLETAAKSWGRV
jgi:hypothetical protein